MSNPSGSAPQGRRGDAVAGPLVSVIIPTYNRAVYVVGAVESALAQRAVATELLVVDDGSTDDTRAMLEPYFDRITYIAQANAGVSAARNAAIRRAHGTLIAFLDSDDIWEPFKLDAQVRFLADHPEVGLICSDFSGFDDSGFSAPSHIDAMFPHFGEIRQRLGERFARCDGVTAADRVVRVYSGDVFDIMVRGYFTLTSTVVIRRSVIEECGFFDEALHHSEDYDYYLRVSRRHRIAYMDLPTARYRRGHADQLSGGVFGSRRQVAGLQNWLRLAERIREEDPTYYRGHRRLVDRVVAERRMWVALARDHAGDHAAAARGFLRAMRDDPARLRLYGYCIRAWLRAGRSALRQGAAADSRTPAGG
jgi:glycosyltransferase involved in cell wall biosynthesis